MTPQQLVKLGHLTGIAIVVLHRAVLVPRMDRKAYKKAYESARARELYLANMIDNAGIEVTEFDLIALSNL